MTTTTATTIARRSPLGHPRDPWKLERGAPRGHQWQPLLLVCRGRFAARVLDDRSSKFWMIPNATVPWLTDFFELSVATPVIANRWMLRPLGFPRNRSRSSSSSSSSGSSSNSSRHIDQHQRHERISRQRHFHRRIHPHPHEANSDGALVCGTLPW